MTAGANPREFIRKENRKIGIENANQCNKERSRNWRIRKNE